MCRPLSHVASPPGGGGACGSTLVTELVTLRLSAGWLETSPARLVAADNAMISDAVAIVLNIFPVPPKASRYQRSNPIASSFDIGTFACRPRQTRLYLRSGNPLRSRPTARKDASADRAASQSRYLFGG